MFHYSSIICEWIGGLGITEEEQQVIDRLDVAL